MPREPKHPIYSIHPAVYYMQNIIAAMKEKTGRALEEWIDLVRRAGPATEAACRDWLKTAHGLGTNYAGWVASRAHGTPESFDENPETYMRAAVEFVEGQYAGPKAALAPIRDALIKLGLSLGKDVKVCPCKTMIPFYREHVFAQIKPATRTRVDLGLAFGGMKARGRLIETGGFAKKDRITHRIGIESLADIDGEVRQWLQKAYDMDGPAGAKAPAGMKRVMVTSKSTSGGKSATASKTTSTTTPKKKGASAKTAAKKPAKKPAGKTASVKKATRQPTKKSAPSQKSRHK